MNLLSRGDCCRVSPRSKIESDCTQAVQTGTCGPIIVQLLLLMCGGRLKWVDRWKDIWEIIMDVFLVAN